MIVDQSASQENVPQMEAQVRESGSKAEANEPGRVGPLAWLAFAAILAAISFSVAGGLKARTAADQALVQATDAAAVSIVNTVHPTLAAPTQEIVLPGNMQAYIDSPIYARTAGYLQKWYFDIGAHVKKGDLLAEIETPEIDQQLQQANADLETARANYELANTTATRWQALLKTNSVSKQETDQAVANMAAQKAMVDSKEANVRRLQQLQSFEKVYAPFDGVITARNTDTGALIDAGSAQQSKELFHLAGIDQLRLFVPVPEVYSNAAQSGAMATLSLDEFPGRTFRGTLVRNSNTIDPASRTLLVEVDVQNPTGELLPGAYVSVHLRLPRQIRSVTVPANTLLFRREGLRVAVAQNGKAILEPITIGRDFGATVEVVSGLRNSDVVILDPSDSLVTGTPVRLADERKAGHT